VDARVGGEDKKLLRRPEFDELGRVLQPTVIARDGSLHLRSIVGIPAHADARNIA